MTQITTRFTQRFQLKHPLAQAGMAFAGEKEELAIAVSRAGGIGAIGTGLISGETLRATIGSIRRAGVAAFNINFITVFGNQSQVEVAAEEKVPVVSFHWGHPPMEQIDLLKAAGCSIWIQVGNAEDARKAVGYGAEVIIAQSHEAGGHNYQGMGAMALIPVIVDAVGKDALVLAAGGIADGRGVAAALSLGADGVWVGTRLVASSEANVHPDHHRRLVAANGEDAVLSSIFGPEMPAFNPMRLQNSRVVQEWNHRLAEVPTDRAGLDIIGETTLFGQHHVKRKFDVILPTADTTGDLEEMAWLMGQGVGLVKDILPAAVIVDRMMTEAAAVLRVNAARVA